MYDTISNQPDDHGLTLEKRNITLEVGRKYVNHLQ
jgi:hypothetical protein